MVCRPGFEKDPLERMRHTCAHVMADAVQKLFPEAKITIGPVIEEGFFYDFDYAEGFTPQDLEKIEARMAEIIRQDLPLQRREIPKKEAFEFFRKRGENYKLEILEGIPDETVSLYSHGDFTDLCKGPHADKTGAVKAFKLLKVSGAYWRGDENNPQLQRIYGTAFESQKELEDYLHRLEEASKRDHRKLGTALELFHIDPEIGGGLILWQPKGATLRRVIEDFLYKELTAGGYRFVNTPHVGRQNLWQTSGHLDFYKENMYAPMDVEGQTYYLKPMNCPFHIAIYRARKHSYRELPIRLAEFGTVYRFERSGVLHGLTRVRGFTQDDAHIFCAPDQVSTEIEQCLGLVLKILRAFGLADFKAYVSTKPEKVSGSDQDWEMATKALKDAVQVHNINYEIDEGGGVFYGPKIDLKIKDALGRFWQLSTIQFDFNLPERFKISYQGSDGNSHRPVMIHRALLGSFERFLGVLIEHYAGAFPVWLSPVQVLVLNLTDTQKDYCAALLHELQEEGIRAEWDDRNEKLGLKIREGQIKKVPYMLVVGNREVAENKISVRSGKEGDLGTMSRPDFLERIRKETQRRLP